jgi:hypothetical protein
LIKPRRYRVDGAFSHTPRPPITGLTQSLGAIFTSRNFVSGASSATLRRITMKSTFINTRNVALLVAAGLLAGTGTAIAEETPAPTSTVKPQTEYQKAKAAYSAAVEAYIANRKSSQAQYKAAVDTFTAARKSYNDARKNVLATYKAELTAARTTREAAIAAATTDAAKLAANTAHRTAVAAATAKRDAAITALGVAPAAPATPLIGTRPTPPAKPAKAAKTS